jgi:hypothetical protein
MISKKTENRIFYNFFYYLHFFEENFLKKGKNAQLEKDRKKRIDSENGLKRKTNKNRNVKNMKFTKHG